MDDFGDLDWALGGGDCLGLGAIYEKMKKDQTNRMLFFRQTMRFKNGMLGRFGDFGWGLFFFLVLFFCVLILFLILFVNEIVRRGLLLVN